MESFIEKNNMFSPSQYGFRKGHSTQHAILDIVKTIQTNMDKRLFSCGVFIDLKKAFDTVIILLFRRSNTDNSNWFFYLSEKEYYFWCSTRFCLGSTAFSYLY